MIETTLLLAPKLSVTTRAADPAPLSEQSARRPLENAALHVENAALQEQVRELAARLGEHSVEVER